MELHKRLESLLFISGEPISEKDAARILECSKEELSEAIPLLESDLASRGVRLIRHENIIQLSTAPEASRLAERMAKEGLEGDLSKSAIETLAIILWKGKVSRSGIDYIRGVNSSFALRTLLIRGLVEREHDASDARVFQYKPTIDLLKYIGVTHIKDLPEIEEIQKELKEYD
jgi:segregation and condensation protein B